jgi:hypothetical protein
MAVPSGCQYAARGRPCRTTGTRVKPEGPVSIAVAITLSPAGLARALGAPAARDAGFGVRPRRRDGPVGRPGLRETRRVPTSAGPAAPAESRTAACQ